MSSSDKVSLYPSYCSIIKLTPKEGYEISSNTGFIGFNYIRFDMDTINGKNSYLELTRGTLQFSPLKGPLGAFGSMCVFWEKYNSSANDNVKSVRLSIPVDANSDNVMNYPLTNVNTSGNEYCSAWSGLFRIIEGIYISGSVKVQQIILAVSM